MVELFVNSGDPNQMLQNAVSDLGLHCLPITFDYNVLTVLSPKHKLIWSILGEDGSVLQ